MTEENLQRVCVKEACLDKKEKRHFMLKIKKVEDGEMYDTHECIVTLNSDEELSNLISKRNIIKLLKLIEEPLGFQSEETYPHIVRVLDQESTLSEDKKQMDIVFHIINNIER